jgi:hypothetical protein
MGLAACAPAVIATPTLAPIVVSPIPPSLTPPAATNTAVPAPSPTSEASSVPTAEPTAEPMLEELFQTSTEPVLQAGFRNALTYIDPGAVIVHEGVFHMFYNGINSFPAPVGVGHATSTDGLHWTRASDEPVFGPAAAGWPDEMGSTNLFVTSGLVEPDGTWVLYYYTLDNSGNFNGTHTIGRATAPGPDGPWTTSPEPLLEPGPAGAWDSRQVSAPDVTRTDDGYVMFYDAASEDRLWKIGRATSPDGLTWTKYDDPTTTDTAFAESDPVLTAMPGAWPATRVIDPNASLTGDGWLMIYATNTGTTGKYVAPDMHMAFATSPDGITWSQASQPVFVGGQRLGWQGIYLISLAERDDGYYLFFDVATTGTDVYLARYDGQLAGQ